MSFIRPIFQDVELDASSDLKIANGDFVVAPSDQRNIEDILASEKGNYRENGVVGVGIVRFLNFNRKAGRKGALIKRIRLQLELDNFRVSKLDLKGDVLNGIQAIDMQADRIK